jgi:phosphoserine aminotransferase
MAKRVANFYAGPSTLPLDCLKLAQKEFLDFKGTGMSIIEISHRSKEFETVVNEAEKDLKDLLSIPDNYSVIFLHGGASFQFPLVPMNLRQDGKVPAYISTGEWSKKAIKEAKLMGDVKTLASSEDRNFCYIPDVSKVQVPADAAYLHITSNNTIFGTQYREFPQVPAGVPLVADMSSDFLWRPFDVSKFGLIYAGAQKNVGPSGLAVIIIRNDLLEMSDKQKIPTFFKYSTHAKEHSLYNTPNSFGIYMVGLVLKKLKKTGGLQAMQARNEEKAKILYDAIDSSGLYKATADKGSRSVMNVTFVLAKKELEDAFLKGANARGLIGLKGHRSVGGFRASIYNAQDTTNVVKLVKYMKEFEAKNK